MTILVSFLFSFFEYWLQTGYFGNFFHFVKERTHREERHDPTETIRAGMGCDGRMNETYASDLRELTDSCLCGPGLG